jgi:mRNA-degrading endonuclease RelE of RelBE toxin-antitoxin system
MYKISVEREVEKQIAALHPNDQKRVIGVIDKLPKTFTKPRPSPHLKKLVGEPSAWRLRVGDVRILFYQNKKKKLLEIYKVGYRGGVY